MGCHGGGQSTKHLPPGESKVEISEESSNVLCRDPGCGEQGEAADGLV